MTPCGHPATHRVVWSARYNHPNHGIVCLRLENRGRQMTATIARRAFIAALGGAAAWPLAARAQQGSRVRRIGVLMLGDENDPVRKAYASAFTQALADLNWTDGRNVRMD